MLSKFLLEVRLPACSGGSFPGRYGLTPRKTLLNTHEDEFKKVSAREHAKYTQIMLVLYISTPLQRSFSGELEMENRT